MASHLVYKIYTKFRINGDTKAMVYSRLFIEGKTHALYFFKSWFDTWDIVTQHFQEWSLIIKSIESGVSPQTSLDVI